MSLRRTILHTEASLGWGGQEIRIHTEMLAMRELGHRLLLAAPRSSQIQRKARESGFEVFDLDDRKLAYPRSILRLRGWIRQHQVGIVNTHSSRDGWIAGIAGRFAGVPLIIRSRHIEVDYPNRWTSRVAFGRLPHLVLTTSARISARLVSELGLDPSRVTCVPTGIDLHRFHPGIDGVIQRDIGLPPGTLLVGMISVLRSWKGHESFLRAAGIIAKSHPGVRFVIAGDGPMREQVKAWISDFALADRVILLGHRDDVPAVIASLAVLVLPSYAHEGIPQIVLQAQAMGTAVIGTTVGGIPEVISPGITGWLVPPKEPEALARALDQLLRDPIARQAIGDRAAEAAAKEYSLEIMCGRLEAIYQRSLSGMAG